MEGTYAEDRPSPRISKFNEDIFWIWSEHTQYIENYIYVRWGKTTFLTVLQSPLHNWCDMVSYILSVGWSI